MRCLDVTLDQVEQNLALDDWLLQSAEEGCSGEVLRLWDATSPFVVVGRGSSLSRELNLEAIQGAQIPVLRRCSGGTSIVAGPGCMFYAVVLSMQQRPELRMVDQAHSFVMRQLLRALRPLKEGIRFDGTCDLVLTNDRKVSGNSLRVARDWLLYHGTLLLDMDLTLLSQYLAYPPREPAYRAGRPHDDFVENLQLSRDEVAAHLQEVWNVEAVSDALLDADAGRIRTLANERYANPRWTESRK